MKIMFIGFDLTPNDKDYIGGGGTYLISVTENLIKAGHEVSNIIITSNPDRKFEIGLKNCKVIIHQKKGNLIDLIHTKIFDYQLYRKIRNEVLLFDPDIFHIHSLQYTKTVLLSSRYIPRIQTIHAISSIFQFYDLFFINDNNTNYHGEIDDRLHNQLNMRYRTILIDHIILSDNILKKLFIKKNLCPSKHLTRLCLKAGYKNSINLNYFQNINERKNGKQRYVLYVGRLNRLKGVDYLIKAFKLSLKKNKKLKLLIIGDGPDRRNLQDLTKKLNLEKKVKFLGEIRNQKLSKYYQNALVVVIPSVGPEGSPLVAYESMNHSKPLIVFDIAGLMELVKEGENGFIINKHNINNLSDRILFLEKNKTLAEKMGQNGRKMLEENWNSEKHLEKLINIYKGVIK